MPTLAVGEGLHAAEVLDEDVELEDDAELEDGLVEDDDEVDVVMVPLL